MGDLWHVPTNNTKLRVEGGASIWTLHATDIVTVWPHGRGVQLNSGGYQTATTKTRMNQIANVHGLCFQVYAKKRAWFVRTAGGDVPFVDGMIV